MSVRPRSTISSIPDQQVELGQTQRQARDRRLGFDLWADPPGGPPRPQASGLDVHHLHIRHIWPMPGRYLAVLLKGYEHILVPEMNTGQLKTVLRDQYPRRCQAAQQGQSGQPFKIAEIEAAIDTYFDGTPGGGDVGEVAADATQLPSFEAVKP